MGGLCGSGGGSGCLTGAGASVRGLSGFVEGFLVAALALRCFLNAALPSTTQAWP